MNDILNDIEFLKELKKLVEEEKAREVIAGKINEVIEYKEKEVDTYEKQIDFFFKDTVFK
jgi:hypothetical protein|tara:strand:- start:3441 stop:3620 length:180 start_codon:yes stop_codon:yes gene_type:complete